MTETDREKAETEIAETVERTLLALVLVEGHHPDLVLGVALARVLTIATERHGGAMAAEAARRAAERCEGLPSFRDSALAGMPARGRA